MKPFLPLAIVAAALPGLAGSAAAQQRFRDQEAAFEGRRSGQIRSLREIEERVVPRMTGSHYLGPEFDAASGTYRLKFMRGGSVIWVDVDGHTGTIIGRSGN